MFNFYVVLGGHNKVSDTCRVTTCRLIWKARSLKTKCTKNKGPFENMSFSKKTVWRFQRKKNTLLAQSKQLRGTHSLQKQQLNMALIKSKN